MNIQEKLLTINLINPLKKSSNNNNTNHSLLKIKETLVEVSLDNNKQVKIRKRKLSSNSNSKNNDKTKKSSKLKKKKKKNVKKKNASTINVSSTSTNTKDNLLINSNKSNNKRNYSSSSVSLSKKITKINSFAHSNSNSLSNKHKSNAFNEIFSKKKKTFANNTSNTTNTSNNIVLIPNININKGNSNNINIISLQDKRVVNSTRNNCYNYDIIKQSLININNGNINNNINTKDNNDNHNHNHNIKLHNIHNKYTNYNYNNYNSDSNNGINNKMFSIKEEKTSLDHQNQTIAFFNKKLINTNVNHNNIRNNIISLNNGLSNTLYNSNNNDKFLLPKFNSTSVFSNFYSATNSKTNYDTGIYSNNCIINNNYFVNYNYYNIDPTSNNNNNNDNNNLSSNFTNSMNFKNQIGSDFGNSINIMNLSNKNNSRINNTINLNAFNFNNIDDAKVNGRYSSNINASNKNDTGLAYSKINKLDRTRLSDNGELAVSSYTGHNSNSNCSNRILKPIANTIHLHKNNTNIEYNSNEKLNVKSNDRILNNNQLRLNSSNAQLIDNYDNYNGNSIYKKHSSQQNNMKVKNTPIINNTNISYNTNNIRLKPIKINTNNIASTANNKNIIETENTNFNTNINNSYKISISKDKDKLKSSKSKKIAGLNSLKSLNNLNIQSSFTKHNSSFSEIERIQKTKQSYREQKLFHFDKQYYYYIINSANNGEIVKEVIKTRTHWKECSSESNSLFNFKWKETSWGIDFTKLNKISTIKQSVSHFEFHQEISNKLNLFVNMLIFCESKGLNVFDYLPMTIVVSTDSNNYTSTIDNFSKVFKNIKRFCSYILNSSQYLNWFKNETFVNDKIGSYSEIVSKTKNNSNKSLVSNINTEKLTNTNSNSNDDMKNMNSTITQVNNNIKKNYSIDNQTLNTVYNSNLITTKTDKQVFTETKTNLKEIKEDNKELHNIGRDNNSNINYNSNNRKQINSDKEIQVKEVNINTNIKTIKNIVKFNLITNDINKKSSHKDLDKKKEKGEIKAKIKANKMLSLLKHTKTKRDILEMYNQEIPLYKQVKYSTLFNLTDFSLTEKAGTRTYLDIKTPCSKNLWLVKAIDMNRGRCIKFSNDLDKLKKWIIKFSEGVPQAFKDLEEEEEAEEMEKLSKSVSIVNRIGIANSDVQANIDKSSKENTLLLSNIKDIGKEIKNIADKENKDNLKNNIQQQQEKLNNNIDIQEKVNNNSNTNDTNTANNINNTDTNEIDIKKAKQSLKRKKRYKSNNILIQKYLENPLLYYGRKFDIRMWVLLTHNMEVFVFKEGHLKTSSMKFNLSKLDSYVHLTNYSVQKYNKDFSKHEIGNEVSFSSFQEFLDKGEFNKTVKDDIYPQIIKIIELSMRSVCSNINLNKRENCFELFGYDFIVDTNFNVYLLEVNTNPGIEDSSPLISMLIPRMVDDMFRLTLDLIFPPKNKKTNNDCDVNKESSGSISCSVDATKNNSNEENNNNLYNNKNIIVNRQCKYCIEQGLNCFCFENKDLKTINNIRVINKDRIGVLDRKNKENNSNDTDNSSLLYEANNNNIIHIKNINTNNNNNFSNKDNPFLFSNPSRYQVIGYSNYENMFELVCDLNEPLNLNPQISLNNTKKRKFKISSRQNHKQKKKKRNVK